MCTRGARVVVGSSHPVVAGLVGDLGGAEHPRVLLGADGHQLSLFAVGHESRAARCPRVIGARPAIVWRHPQGGNAPRRPRRDGAQHRSGSGPLIGDYSRHVRLHDREPRRTTGH
jgi:hypothetical protein